MKDDVDVLGESIKQLLVSQDLLLESAAQYLFETDGGKKVKVLNVLPTSSPPHPAVFFSSTAADLSNADTYTFVVV